MSLDTVANKSFFKLTTNRYSPGEIGHLHEKKLSLVEIWQDCPLLRPHESLKTIAQIECV